MKKYLLIISFFFTFSSQLNPTIIFGLTNKYHLEALTNYTCPICHGKLMGIYSKQFWISLMLVPLLAPEEKIYYLGCLQCEQCFKIKKNANIPALIHGFIRPELGEIIKSAKQE